MKAPANRQRTAARGSSSEARNVARKIVIVLRYPLPLAHANFYSGFDYFCRHQGGIRYPIFTLGQGKLSTHIEAVLGAPSAIETVLDNLVELRVALLKVPVYGEGNQIGKLDHSGRF